MSSLPLPLLLQAARRRFRGVLRDRFLAPQSPAVSGAVEGGTRTVTGTLWRQESGAARGGAQTSSPAWGSSELRYSGKARVAGRALRARILPADAASDIALSFSASATAGDPRTGGHGWIMEDGKFEAITPGGAVVVRGNNKNIKPIELLPITVLGDRGAYTLLSAASPVQSFGAEAPLLIPQFPQARVVWVEPAGADATLHPVLSAYDNIGGYIGGHHVSPLEVIDVPSWAGTDALAAFADRFERADSATTPGNGWTAAPGTVWGINGNRLYLVSGSGYRHSYHSAPANGIFVWRFTTPPSGGIGFFCTFRVAASDQYLAITNSFTTNQIRLQSFAAATPTDLYIDSATFANATTYTIVGIAEDNQIWVYLNGVAIKGGNPIITSTYQTATGVGFGVANPNPSTHYLEDVSVTPLTVTLPIELQRGAVPTIRAGGATLASDDFTGTNGTLLSAHAPTAGPIWSASSDWTIQSNRASNAATGISLALQDVGTNAIEVSATLIMPPVFTLGRVRAGLVVAATDANNYIVVQPFVDNPTQSNSRETEVIQVIAGSTLIQHKVDLGTTTFAAGEQVNIKVQYILDAPGYPLGIIKVFLYDGSAWVNVVDLATSQLFSGTKAGLYRNGSLDEGTTFDNWLAKAL